MNGSAKQAQKHIEPTYRITFYVLDPISLQTMKIEQEWSGHVDYLAGTFHERGVMVKAPNGNSTWYNPSTIVRMTFKKVAEKPIKNQTIFSKTPPITKNNIESEDVIEDTHGRHRFDGSGIPF